MQKNRYKKMMISGLSIMMIGTNLTTSAYATSLTSIAISSLEDKLASPILITEVVPNTKNVNKSDAYEYYELTNTSGKDIVLSDYNILYDNGSKVTPWNSDVEVLPAHATLLVWIKNDGNQTLNKQDFLNYYSLDESTLVAEVQCDGLSNSGERSLMIQTKTGKTLTTLTYRASDSGNGTINEDEAIAFNYQGSQVTAIYDQTPTPTVSSTINGEYVFPTEVENPTLTLNAQDRIYQNEDFTITLDTTNLDSQNITRATVSIDGISNEYEMTYNDQNLLSVTIPHQDYQHLSSLSYQVSLSDGINNATSNKTTTPVLPSVDNVDTTKAPALLISEIVPDSTNIGGSDGYEFIEIFNNANQAINLKDYKLYYTYPDSNSQTIWWETNEDKILQPGEALVFWIKNGPNNGNTLDDFNTFYKTQLTENQVIQIETGGMSNSGIRGLRIATNVNDTIDNVVYNEGVDNVNTNKSIEFRNTYTNNVFTSGIVSDNNEPTPGALTDNNNSDYQATIVTPSTSPVISDQSPTTFNNNTASLSFSVEASSTESTIKTVTLYLKNNTETKFQKYNLLRENGNMFTKTLENVDLINKENFTYYFEVSDGFTTIQTDQKTIMNTSIDKNQTLNIKDGQTLHGTQAIITSTSSLKIDDQDVTTDAVSSINGLGQIVFETSQTDVFFKNAVSIGDEVLGIFNDGTYGDWKTYHYGIDASYYDAATKNITVQFHAGNKANVLEHNIENNDDFVLRNIRMTLPNGKTLYPTSYKANNGLGAVDHDGLKEEDAKPVNITSQETSINMGDGTSKYEILYATFTLEESDFSALRYLLDTTTLTDGVHTIKDGKQSIQVTVDNTAPVITTNIEEGELYRNETIEVSATDALSENVQVVATLDGKTVTLPYAFRSLEMEPGDHTLNITATDEIGNTSTKTITFKTPEENPTTEDNMSPSNGATVTIDPTLQVTVNDPTRDTMTVTFKEGERYVLGDSQIQSTTGISNTAGTNNTSYTTNTGDGFPYEQFEIQVSDTIDQNCTINVHWQGTSNNEKTFMYAYNLTTQTWDKLEATASYNNDQMILDATLPLENYLSNGKVQIMVQNGEGYTPTQYEASTKAVTTSNVADTPREDYDFTFAIESDTQYYNEDYEGNPDQSVDGNYQYQLDIHDWLIQNRERMNIQYLFHDGDIIDDEPNEKEWQQADAAYQYLDDANIPYGILAGNHDVGHLSGDYTNYSKYFGEARYNTNPWYGESYKDNRGHYDLITVDGIDFIMIYMGWGIGDEEIQWMNDVLAKYPERKAILNFHEYLLASGGLGEEPTRIYNELVATNENVCMVLSGHYHNAYTRTDTFTNADGSTRNVYSLLFDYQGLPEGGLGYIRLMHFDMENQKIIFRTYSPSLDDYDAKTSTGDINEGNDYVVSGADDSINGEEAFEISFTDLGITSEVKELKTSNLNVNVYSNNVIGSVENVQSGTTASYTWENAPSKTVGWYAEITDANGGLTRTDVQYLNIAKDTTAPIIIVPENTTIEIGEMFDPMAGVSAHDETDGDLTAYITYTGKVDTSKAGTYTLNYQVADFSGNVTTMTRVINVVEKDSQTPAGDGSENTTPPTDTTNQTPPSSSQDASNTQTSNNVDTNDTTSSMPWIMMLTSSFVSLLYMARRKLKLKK